MIKAIFWDNDGVLVDTEHLYFEATRRVLATVDLELTEALYIELFLVQGRGAWHLAAERGIAAPAIEQLKLRRNTLYGELLRESSCVMPGIADVLAALHGKYVMGIVTSSLRHHFEAVHASTGLLKYFDFVLASGDYARAKPDPDPYLRAIQLSGVPAESCIAVEDSRRGLLAATAAGIRCMVVPGGLTRRQSFDGACNVLAGLGEIPAALARLSAHP